MSQNRCPLWKPPFSRHGPKLRFVDVAPGWLLGWPLMILVRDFGEATDLQNGPAYPDHDDLNQMGPFATQMNTRLAFPSGGAASNVITRLVEFAVVLCLAIPAAPIGVILKLFGAMLRP